MITHTITFDIQKDFTLGDLREFVRAAETNGCDDSQEIHPATDDDGGDIIGFEIRL